MSNDQLKEHLLEETFSVALEKVRRKFDSGAHCEQQSPNPGIDFLGTLFLSGKESAALVRMILSQDLIIWRKYSTIRITLCRKMVQFLTRPGIIENLALRWTSCLEFTDFQRSPEFSSLVQTLRDHNCIERLSLKINEHLSVDNCVAIVEACPNLSTLVCSPDLLVSLLQRVKGTAFAKLIMIEMPKSANNWSLYFEHLKTHPMQCPVLNTLTIMLDVNDLRILSDLASDYSFPAITSYNVSIQSDGQPLDFPLIASAFSMFPALKQAAVAVTDISDYFDPKKLPEIYKLFEEFNPTVEFTFIYIVEPAYSYSETQANEFEVQLRTFGTITSVSREDGQLAYDVTASYPNKILNLKLKIYVDSLDEESEDSEDDDDEEDSDEEGSEDDDDGSEDDDGEPAMKRMKLV